MAAWDPRTRPIKSQRRRSATTVSPRGGATAARPPNLLELVPSKIAVSSTVQNPRDFPEHLMDGNLETAWNGKTGDLVGGSIRFKVPADAKIAYVEMTAGYSRVTDVDLFTANHRIVKLRIPRVRAARFSASMIRCRWLFWIEMWITRKPSCAIMANSTRRTTR